MRIRMALAIAMLCLAALPMAAQAQKFGPGDRWEELGRQTVGFGVDNDTIRLNQNEDFYRNRAYRTLRFTAEGNEVNLIALRLIFMNGYVEDVRVDRTIPRGGELLVDLPGERSYLRQIDMRYRSGIGLSLGGGGIRLQQATVTVYGERARRIDPPPPQGFVGGRWDEIDAQQFSLRDDRVVFRPRGDARVGQVKLRAVRESVILRDAEIRFRNGQVQRVRIDSRLGEGQETPALDLPGEVRNIESVVVNLEPRRRPARAQLALLGTARPGNDGPPGGDRYTTRGWVLLGEQSVGFTQDRDVINVNQSEDFYRDRRFRTLHFVVDGNDIYFNAVRLVFMNGYSEEIRVDRLVPAGTDTPLDLRGDRSYIRQIEMSYRSRPNFSGRAVMRVYGEPSRRP
jgi:hypothetical protein